MEKNQVMRITDRENAGGNYEEIILQHSEQFTKEFGPCIMDTEIRHDNWCGIYKGFKCDCNCEVETKVLDDEGKVIKRKKTNVLQYRFQRK